MQNAVNLVTRQQIIAKMADTHKKHLPALHHDFLALVSVNGYFETDKFYFFQCRLYGIKEVRIWKKSGRVSVSSRFTPRC